MIYHGHMGRILVKKASETSDGAQVEGFRSPFFFFFQQPMGHWKPAAAKAKKTNARYRNELVLPCLYQLVAAMADPPQRSIVAALISSMTRAPALPFSPPRSSPRLTRLPG